MTRLRFRVLAAANFTTLAAGLLALVATSTPVPPPGLGRHVYGTSAEDIARVLRRPDFLAGDPSRKLAGIDWLHGQRVPPGEYVPAGAYARSLEQAAALRRAAPVDPVAAAPWSWLGPTNIGGRVLDIALAGGDPTTVFVATAGGGVWKSTDGGLTYNPAWPLVAPQAIGAIATLPDGVVLAGTGEAGPGGGSTTFGGTGIFRSTDGGATWKWTGLAKSGAVGRIVVDPKNPAVAYAAATGDLYRPGGDRGVYKSTDGGVTWRRVLAAPNATTGAVDLAIDPVNPQRLYAAMWDHRRFPTHRAYGGSGSGVYESRDGGAKWRRIVDIAAPDPDEDPLGRIGVAISASDPNRVYVVGATGSGAHAGFWVSRDGGKTFTVTGSGLANTGGGFAWWFGRVWVDPRIADRVFVAGVGLQESLNAGQTFASPHVGLHADQHAMAWHPTVPGLVWEGNDGGMYVSRTNGVAGTWVPSRVQGWTQHYSLDVSEQNVARVITGLQDNGCQRNYVAGGVTRNDTWNQAGLCGDGLQTLINYRDENVVYHCSQYGSCSRSQAGGLVPGMFGPTESDRRNWWTPVQFDPTDPAVMYYGGNVLNRSTNGGTAWTAISPDLSSDPEQRDPTSSYQNYGTITTVAAAPKDPKTLLVGLDEGRLWVTRDLGERWTLVKAKNLPKAWVTRVTIDPARPTTFYAVFSGYRGGDAASHVFRSTDAGRTWRDVSGNLPNSPVNDVVFAGSALIVGTDTGVYLSRDGGKRWLAVGKGLPTVPVFDLRWHAGSKTLTAATFGRGIMRVTLPL